MWHTWCAPNCKTGFCSNVVKKTNRKQEFQRQKNENEIKDFFQGQFYAKTRLRRAIPQKKLIVNNSCKICDKHFVEADIDAITTNSWKTTESGNEPVKLKSLSETICNYQYFFQPLKRIVKQTTKTLLFWMYSINQLLML